VFHAKTNTIRRVALAGLIASSITLGTELVDAGPFDRPGTSSPATRRADYQTEAPQQQVTTHRLSYLNASWDKVLNDLAKSSGRQLIMSDVPPGKFTRRDFVPHSTQEAVRILNQELERQGFRILEQKDYLIVVDLASIRTRYERSTVAAPAPATRRGGDQQITTIAPPREPVRRFSQVQVDDQSAAQPSPQRPGSPRAESGVRQIAHEISTTLEQAEPLVTRKVHPKASVVDVGRYLHESFGESSRLIDSGPAGLPAFEVNRFQGRPGAKPVSFAVGIDADGNRLVIEGTQSVAEQLERTIGMLDRALHTRDDSIEIVPSVHDVTHLARELGPSLNQLVALHNQTEQGAANQADSEEESDRVQIPIGPRAPDGSFPGIDSTDITTEMRGNVVVQAMPELGVLILTGNKKDVDAVMAVIKEIEAMAVGTTPSVRLHVLVNVDSTQLSTLLDTVYQDLTGRRPTAAGQTTAAQDNRRKVTFIPVVRPNAILIIAPEGDMEAVLTLIDSLDIPVDPETVFEVFALKAAIAAQTATLLSDYFSERVGLSGTINVFFDARTNSVIVRARPIDLNEAASLIRKIDRDASGSVSKIKVIELRNSVAQEVADVLNQALQSLLLPPGQDTLGGFGALGAAGTGQTAQLLREVKSVAVEFLSTQGGREELIRSGVLADIRINADPRINSLVVTAPAKSMALLEALIYHLDRLPSSIAEIKVFTLQNSDATRAAELLSSLFATTAAGAAGAAQTPGAGIQVSGATDISNSLVQMRFTVDIRTNTIVAVGGADALRLVEAILLRLDQDDIRQRKTAIIRLKNTQATELATTVNAFLDSQRQLALSTPDLVSNIELLEREIVVVAEPFTNSLMISATERYFDSITEMIGKLDQAPAEVIIQALLVEVDLGNIDEFGVELGLQDSILFNRGLGMPGFLFNSSVVGNDTTAPGSNIVGTQGLSNLGVGRTNNDAGFGGLVLSASSESVSVLIRALASRRNVQILSRPQIRTLDNVQATIQVGQQVPIVTGVTQTVQSTNPVINQQDTGIILTVLPRINPDGTIVMQTTAEKSALSGEEVPIFVDVQAGVISSPIIDKSGAQSTVSISNGHTIVMGGMITKRDSTIQRKVPWLGDVPLLGRAFRFDSTSSQRSELLIFLTPRVVLNEGDSEYIKQVESDRLHFIEDDAEEVHGPLFGVPAEPSYYEDHGPIRLPDGSVMRPENYPNLQLPGTEETGIRQTSATEPAEKAGKKSLKPWPFKR
jgi:general secretion pathway protein D